MAQADALQRALVRQQVGVIVATRSSAPALAAKAATVAVMPQNIGVAKYILH